MLLQSLPLIYLFPCPSIQRMPYPAALPSYLYPQCAQDRYEDVLVFGLVAILYASSPLPLRGRFDIKLDFLRSVSTARFQFLAANAETPLNLGA